MGGTEFVDPSAVEADDELVDALANGRTPPHGHDAALIAVLSWWRSDIEAEPLP